MAINVEQLYEKYGPMVLRRCRSILRDEDSALDAMQDVFVQIIRRQEKLDAFAPSSLLYTIATNTCLNLLKKHKRTAYNDSDEILLNIAGADDPAEKALSNHFMDRLFNSEPVSTRTIAVMHYVDRMTLEETAEAVGLSVSGVRKRLRKLRVKGLALKEV